MKIRIREKLAMSAWAVQAWRHACDTVRAAFRLLDGDIVLNGVSNTARFGHKNREWQRPEARGAPGFGGVRWDLFLAE